MLSRGFFRVVVDAVTLFQQFSGVPTVRGRVASWPPLAEPVTHAGLGFIYLLG